MSLKGKSSRCRKHDTDTRRSIRCKCKLKTPSLQKISTKNEGFSKNIDFIKNNYNTSG